MENKRIFKIVLTGIMICGLFTTAMAKDIPVSYTHLTLPTNREV